MWVGVRLAHERLGGEVEHHFGFRQSELVTQLVEIANVALTARDMLTEREQPEMRRVSVRCESDTGYARASSRQEQRQP